MKENVPLSEYTTMRIGGNASYLFDVYTESELEEAVIFAQEKKLPIFILGGGSNLLVNDSGFDGVVLHVCIPGITYEDGDSEVLVTVGAGVNWDVLVADTVDRGYWGLENLSAIPGLVGASPVQNIGAYGIEAKDSIVSVKTFDMASRKWITLSNMECSFGYRNSLFKKADGKDLVVTAVTFRLRKNGTRHLSYKDLALYFKDNIEPTLKEIRDAIIDIRSQKLPDLKKFGTAGSYFTNAVIDREQYEILKKQYPDLPGFDEPNGKIKISTGWVIDNVLKMKGVCIGDACVYEKQALVLINKGKASAKDLLTLVEDIKKKFFDKTKIKIESEVVYL